MGNFCTSKKPKTTKSIVGVTNKHKIKSPSNPTGATPTAQRPNAFLQNKLIIRYVILAFMDIEEITKLALLSQEFNKLIDSNKYMLPEHEISRHLELVICEQNDISQDLFDKIKTRMVRYEQCRKLGNGCVYLNDIF